MKFEKGRPVPLTDDEKTALALQYAINNHPDWSDCVAWPNSFSINNVSTTPIDDNKNRYKASGSAVVGRKHKIKSMILMPLDVEFDITFVDGKDSWSLPDVSVESFKFKVIGLSK